MLYTKNRGEFITMEASIGRYNCSEFKMPFLKNRDIVVFDELPNFKPVFGKEIARNAKTGFSESFNGFHSFYTYFEVARTLEEGDNVVYHGRSDASSVLTQIARVIVKNGDSIKLCTRWVEEGVLKEHVDCVLEAM